MRRVLRSNSALLYRVVLNAAHPPHTGPGRWRYPEDDRPAQIPLGALKVAKVSNLWTAARCISCDHEAKSSLRVIGTCLATGQAAGLAAAWYVRHGAPPGAADVRAQIETILGPEEDRSR